MITSPDELYIPHPWTQTPKKNCNLNSCPRHFNKKYCIRVYILYCYYLYLYNYTYYIYIYIYNHFYFPAELVGGFYPQRSSGRAVVTGVAPSPRHVPSVLSPNLCDTNGTMVGTMVGTMTGTMTGTMVDTMVEEPQQSKKNYQSNAIHPCKVPYIIARAALPLYNNMCLVPGTPINRATPTFVFMYHDVRLRMAKNGGKFYTPPPQVVVFWQIMCV